MKTPLLIVALLGLSLSLFAQNALVAKNSELYQTAPQWAKLMYSENPNVYQVDQAYLSYYKSHAYKKSYHTQYYKRWRKAVGNFINHQGYIDVRIKEQQAQILVERQQNQSQNRNGLAGNWTVMGPFESFKEGGAVLSGAQANVYSIDYCAASPNILYCGTESGEVYKTTDSGDHWFNASYNLVTALAPGAVIANAGIHATAVHPTNPDIVYIGSGTQVFKTTNGGDTWELVFDSNIPLGGYMENPAEIHINKNNPNIVLLAGKAGIHKTTNGGNTWSLVHPNVAFDIKAKPGSPNTLYTVTHNPALNTHQFLISTDSGTTWTVSANDWYQSSDPNRSVLGARIAVTEADSKRIYAYLIGDSKAGDHGFIGVYRSDNAGATWYNTMNYDGAPFTDPGHQNLIGSNPVTGGFNQGFYNCAIMASNTNPDEILVGGIGMWYSNDGGATFNCMYNYGCGDYEPMHVDMQDFRALGNTYWATTDGGVYKSDDLFTTQPEFKMNGVNGTDFWGFGSGWNYDLLVGGTFHNGVDVYSENFPDGVVLDLGGGEPASGYVHPSQSRVYSSNIGSKYIPQSISEAVLYASAGMTPNESPWIAQSSEMEFHPSCYNQVYLGYEHQLFKSFDAGENFTAVYDGPINSKVFGIEISRANTATMFIVVKPESGNTFLAKTTDDWEASTTITLPQNGSIPALITLNPENDQEIWVAFPHGNDGSKIYRSYDGGMSWSNETSSELNAQRIQSITTIGGTDGGIYLGTGMSCYYKNDSMSAWAIDNLGLPSTIGTTGIRPFYRDGKIRLASYGKGIWESQLYETPSRPVAKIMVDKLTANCLSDVFYFDDYSLLNHTNATWAWTFEDANIASASIRNPEVIFNSIGTHEVTLTVTNAAGISDTDTITVDVEGIQNAWIDQDFELEFLPNGWLEQPAGNLQWSYENTVGGFGQSTNCMVANNFVASQAGDYCEIMAPISLENMPTTDAMLTFDVAYALYSSIYPDALEVLVSTDCGSTWTSVFYKEGSDLATHPETTSQFIPTAADWRTETIDLSAYVNTSIYISFRNINAFGQALYIDNINIGNEALNVEAPQTFSFAVYPNPVASQGGITIKSNSTQEVTLSLYSIQGKLIDTIFTETNTRIPIHHYHLSTGIYLYKLRTAQNIHKGKLIVAGE